MNKLTKVCNNCKKELSINMFYKDTTKKDGLHTICKICRQKNDKEYYRKNKKRIQKRSNLYYHNNKDRVLPRMKTYYHKNKDKIRQQVKKNRQKYRKKINMKERKYYQKPKVKERIKIRRKGYQPKVRANANKRYKNDIGYRLVRVLRGRVQAALKNGYKSKTTIELLGCSIKECKNHLEKQFNEGMTWENYGKWHVDHILPCNTFDLTKPEEQKKCFHYSNLRPLWAEENMKRPKDGSDITDFYSK